MPNLPQQFKLYLQNHGASSVTVKNYLSDFNHFWGWLILRLKSRAVSLDLQKSITLITKVTPLVINDYKEFLLVNKTPVKTINRRLSTLRKWGGFCLSQKWLASNPAKEVANVSEKRKKVKTASQHILVRFREDLEKEKVSPVTIKNYLSDLRHFLAFLEAN